MSRPRSVWRYHDRPGCFSHQEIWRDWLALRQDAPSPCVDCSPDYRDLMQATGRCVRPEVIFVFDPENGEGELEGITADDPRYVQVLQGGFERQGRRSEARQCAITTEAGQPMRFFRPGERAARLEAVGGEGEQVGYTREWANRLLAARRWAIPEVQGAISVWLLAWAACQQQGPDLAGEGLSAGEAAVLSRASLGGAAGAVEGAGKGTVEGAAGGAAVASASCPQAEAAGEVAHVA